MDIIEIERNALLSLQDTLNNLIIRISGVSDLELKDTLKDEYLHLTELINFKTIEIQELEMQYFKMYIGELINEFCKFYENQFKSVSLLDAIKKFNLLDECNKYRLRPITSIKQKRDLSILLSLLNCYIDILDYESNIIDTLGKKDKQQTRIIIYVNLFRRFGNTSYSDENLIQHI